MIHQYLDAALGTYSITRNLFIKFLATLLNLDIKLLSNVEPTSVVSLRTRKATIIPLSPPIFYQRIL